MYVETEFKYGTKKLQIFSHIPRILWSRVVLRPPSKIMYEAKYETCIICQINLLTPELSSIEGEKKYNMMLNCNVVGFLNKYINVRLQKDLAAECLILKMASLQWTNSIKYHKIKKLFYKRPVLVIVNSININVSF